MTIQIIYSADGNGKDLKAVFSVPPETEKEIYRELDTEAAKLLSQMRLDALDKPDFGYGEEPESFHQFDALAWLADSCLNESCMKDYQDRWRSLDAAPEGVEPELGRLGRFNIDWKGLDIEISYDPNWMGWLDHVEVRKIGPESAQLPISETGYRSIFADREDVVAAGGVKGLIVAMLDQADTPKTRQLAFF